MRFSALSPGFVPVIQLLKPNASFNAKGCLLYNLHEQSYICHRKLSHKNCSCKWALK